MKSVKANPGARRLLSSLRNMGYDCSTAIADVVDNSITADASEIHVDILTGEIGRPAAIVISDNGKGMDRDALHEAMRFGADQQYDIDDLGRFGLGLKTASLSQCKTLTVSSKPKAASNTRSIRHAMRWDVEHVYETDDWDLLVPSDDELQEWEKKILHNISSNGTVVLWTGLEEALPLLSSKNEREKEMELARLMKEVTEHLRMVFHRFMQGSVSGKRKVDIYVCEQKLLPWDPFCRSENTKEQDITKYPMTTSDESGSKMRSTVVVSPFILPPEEEFSSTIAWRDASGPRGWNQQQGFYFYRNNRLLQAGGWSNLRSVDEHTKLLRIAVDFTSGLDTAFQINITKMKARIPSEIREKLKSLVGTLSGQARSRYDKKVRGSSQSTFPAGADEKTKHPAVSKTYAALGPLIFSSGNRAENLVIKENKKTRQIEIIVPQGHDCSSIFSIKAGGSGDLKKLCVAMLAILEAVQTKKVNPSKIPIDALKKLYRRIA